MPEFPLIPLADADLILSCIVGGFGFGAISALLKYLATRLV